jgi:DNA-binding NarL/FixJ family response regulator
MPNILIADDHDLVRDTIAAYLEKSGEFSVRLAGSLDAAADVLKGDLPIDLAVLDYNMPGMNGLTGMAGLIARYPHCKFALMSGIATADVAHAAMEQGAQGFLPKSVPASSMLNAIRFMLAGERYFPVGFSSATPANAEPASFMGLSGREMETLRHLCEGQSNKEIARDLGVQEVTVKLHVKNVLAKLGVSNRTQAALMAKEQGVF